MLDQHLLALSATKVALNDWVTIYHAVLRGREGLRRPCPREINLAAACKFKFCPRCHKRFSRLDTHLRSSATCPSVQISCPVSVHSMSHSTLESSSCSTLPSSVPLQLSSESTSIIPQPVGLPSGAADIDPFPQPTCSTPQSATATFEPTPKPKLQPHSAQEWEKANTFFAHDVVPRVLQASSIEDKHIVLVEGIFNYFADAYGTKEKKRSCKKRQRKIASKLRKAKEMKNDVPELFHQGIFPLH